MRPQLGDDRRDSRRSVERVRIGWLTDYAQHAVLGDRACRPRRMAAVAGVWSLFPYWLSMLGMFSCRRLAP
jgi:hypothetical protein